MELRPYQQEAVDAVWKYLREHDGNPCVVLPTASGKSLVISKLVTDAVKNWNGRVMVLAHVKELLEQNAGKIKALCPDLDVGVYSAGLKSRDMKNDVIVAGIQSVYNKGCEFGKVDIVIIDEAHMVPPDGEGTYRTFLKDVKTGNPQMRVIGLTATPFRLHGGLICKPENILNAICYEAGLKEMIVNGYLSPMISKSGSAAAKLDDLHIRAGEFIQEEVNAAMDKDNLVLSACNEIVSLTKDRKAVLIFGCSVKHCRHIQECIQEISGEECALVTGETPAVEREDIIRRFRGEEGAPDLFGTRKPPLKYVVNVNVMTTGLDVPRIDCIAMMRPTASPGLLLQAAGRGFRLAEGKANCLFLDYGENIMRHGPLDAIKVKETRHHKKKDTVPAKKCPQCQSLMEIGRMVCPDCGYVFPERDIHHDATASTEGVLSGEISVFDLPVQSIRYMAWRKRGDENAPTTMCVEYMIDLTRYIREWVCPEHTGYARRKFEAWWRERATDADCEEPPTSVEEALALANTLRVPTEITVRHVAGEKYDRIAGAKFGAGTVEAIVDAPAPEEEPPADDDIPF